jgi:hypothetical protein
VFLILLLLLQPAIGGSLAALPAVVLHQARAQRHSGPYCERPSRLEARRSERSPRRG